MHQIYGNTYDIPSGHLKSPVESYSENHSIPIQIGQSPDLFNAPNCALILASALYIPQTRPSVMQCCLLFRCERWIMDSPRCLALNLKSLVISTWTPLDVYDTFRIPFWRHGAPGRFLPV